MPGAGFKVNTMRVRKIIRQVLDVPYDMVKAKMVRCELIHAVFFCSI